MNNIKNNRLGAPGTAIKDGNHKRCNDSSWWFWFVNSSIKDCSFFWGRNISEGKCNSHCIYYRDRSFVRSFINFYLPLISGLDNIKLWQSVVHFELDMKISQIQIRNHKCFLNVSEYSEKFKSYIPIMFAKWSNWMFP